MEVQWVEGDAEALPFSGAEFDVVMSAVGAIFAPRHQRVADEMLRVCKPGGRIAMVSFTPESIAADFFSVFTPYMLPSRAGALPPALWCSEVHVEQLFGARLEPLQMTHHTYVERADGPRAYRDFCKRTFGPVAVIFAELGPERSAELDSERRSEITSCAIWFSQSALQVLLQAQPSHVVALLCSILPGRARSLAIVAQRVRVAE